MYRQILSKCSPFWIHTAQIKQAIDWFLTKLLNDKKRKARNKTIFLLNKKDHKDVVLGSGKTDTAWAFTKEDILNVVELDLETVFLTCNGKTWRQKQGCPIGGFLSAAYANIKCMYDEYKFLRGLRNDARKIYAIRQMDDLITWIAYMIKEGRTQKDGQKE